MRDKTPFIVILGAVAFIAVLLLMQCSVSSDTDRAERALRSSGFSDPKILGSHVLAGFNGCDENDSAAFDAEATNMRGERVKLVVCCGFIKSCTVRVP